MTHDIQVPSTTNSHPMVTRSKNGIYKPKALLAKASSIKHAKTVPTKPTTPDYTIIEPPSFKVAVQYPQWFKTMDEEFVALQR